MEASGGKGAALRGVPPGVRVFVPPEAASKRRLEEELLEVFTRWGFQEIVTPALDYYEPPAPGTFPAADDTFKLIDRETGGLLNLRADITPQVARIASTLLRHRPRPLRLCYVTNVFRHTQSRGMVQQEFFQGGVELIGLDSLEADVEMIAIAQESLQASAVGPFRVTLGHTGFIAGVLEAVRLPPSLRAKVQEAVRKKDASALEAFVARNAPDARLGRVLLELPRLFGGPEVLEEARELVRNRRSRRALAELSRVYRMLDLYGLTGPVSFDLSAVKDFQYYTGVVFEAFLERFGYPVCSGGRYDQLLGRYGQDALGTGFAIDVGLLLLALGEQGAGEAPAADYLIIDSTRQKRGAIRLARQLRARGFRVARDIIRRDLEGSLAYARQMGIPRCLLLGQRGMRSREVRLVDLRTGAERSFDLSQSEQLLASGELKAVALPSGAGEE
ncbi:MAG: ATP phosphoribosyltransferase regulatory subunit [Nitrospinota bacterium]